jgi:hypothetical protein
MNEARFPLKLATSIQQDAKRLAAEDGVSLNDWIASAVAQKIGAVETAAEFFHRRAGAARAEGLHGLLKLAPERIPDAGDEL